MEPQKRILNMEALTNHGNVAGRKAVAAILEAGLVASDPYPAVFELVRIKGNKMTVGKKDFEPTGSPRTGDDVYDLSKFKHIYVLGAGKGIQRVAKAFEDLLGDRLTGGHVVDKKGSPIICQKIGVTLGAHPAPDADCVRGCEKIYEIIQKLTPEDLVFTCVANGVSALMTMPVPGLNIDDVSEVTRVMQIQHGATTGDLNAIRNHIDMMKGARITRYIHQKGAKAIHILAIDPGTWKGLMYDNLWLHTLPDYTTFELALANIKKYDAWNEIPGPVKDFLQKADPKYESVKGPEFEAWGDRIFGLMPGYRQTSKIWPAMKKAEELGFRAVYLNEENRSIESRQSGIFVAGICKTIERIGLPFEPPVALFCSGEMIVTVGKETGIGGRNQEFCLSAAQVIAGSKNIVIGSVDTDGTDGPGCQYGGGALGVPDCLAGGLVDGETMAEAKKAGINVVDELKRHNTSEPLWKIGSGVWAIPNISLIDLTVALVLKKNE
jgi:glycerate 2-kinase